MLSIHKNSIGLLLVLVGIGMALSISNVRASSVQPMTVETLADHSGQVIEGVVASVRSYWAAGPRRIESEVTFAQVQYLKGALPDAGDTFSLTVPGGTVGEVRMQVCCAPDFRVGDKWILCLLPSYETFPVVGLHQGAFLVRADQDGVERIAYERHGVAEPIVGVDGDGFLQVARRHPRKNHPHPHEAHNVRVNFEPAESAPPQGLSRDEFVALLHPVLTASRDHQLATPAGRRVLVEYTPVPLKCSDMQKDLDHRRPGNGTPQTLPRREAPLPQEAEGTARTPAVSGKEVQR